MIVVNLKTYSEVTLGSQAVNLARIAETVAAEQNIPIILCVQATDIYKVSQAVSLPVFAQHIDPFPPGKYTGFTSGLAVKENGAKGVMINHSEHRIGMENVKKCLEVAKQEGLQTLVCVETAQEAQEVDTYQPDMIALEDPVLIGGSESIVHNPSGKQKVEEFVNLKLHAKPLVGAGVKDAQDVITSLHLGAAGVLLASGVALASNPKAVLTNLCKGFSQKENIFQVS
ncbi:MAG: triose-phosphate isomerase [Patescibacteria group bacterium]|jgi:triosephosphate isomerase